MEKQLPRTRELATGQPFRPLGTWAAKLALSLSIQEEIEGMIALPGMLPNR